MKRAHISCSSSWKKLGVLLCSSVLGIGCNDESRTQTPVVQDVEPRPTGDAEIVEVEEEPVPRSLDQPEYEAQGPFEARDVAEIDEQQGQPQAQQDTQDMQGTGKASVAAVFVAPEVAEACGLSTEMNILVYDASTQSFSNAQYMQKVSKCVMQGKLDDQKIEVVSYDDEHAQVAESVKQQFGQIEGERLAVVSETPTEIQRELFFGAVPRVDIRLAD